MDVKRLGTWTLRSDEYALLRGRSHYASRSAVNRNNDTTVATVSLTKEKYHVVYCR